MGWSKLGEINHYQILSTFGKSSSPSSSLLVDWWRLESRFSDRRNGLDHQNEEGCDISQGSNSRGWVCSALMAEAIALHLGLSSATQQNLQSLHIFSDSLVLISALRSGQDLNEIAGVLHDIRNLATLFNPLSFNFISHTKNFQADLLAMSALSAFIVVENS